MRAPNGPGILQCAIENPTLTIYISATGAHCGAPVIASIKLHITQLGISNCARRLENSFKTTALSAAYLARAHGNMGAN